MATLEIKATVIDAREKDTAIRRPDSWKLQQYVKDMLKEWGTPA